MRLVHTGVLVHMGSTDLRNRLGNLRIHLRTEVRLEVPLVVLPRLVLR